MNQKSRMPNLGTILMVEIFLEENRDFPIKKSQILKNLPKKVMSQTLNVILEYLFESGKIFYSPKGIQWIYVKGEVMDKLKKISVEI